MKSIKVKCPAKINLNLKITGKRDDGFHNIESLMQTINLFDYLTINIEDYNELKIVLDGNSDKIPYDKSNLVYKAAELFIKESEIKNKKITIYIEKNIPIAAGLAGGSTDAAGTIFGLNELFGKILSVDDMHKLCASLGSDLNVCLRGGRILAKGRGEIIESLPFEEFNVSLIKPINLGISAKEAYTKYSEKIKNTPPTAQRATSPLKGAEDNTNICPMKREENCTDICPLKGGNAEAEAEAKGVRVNHYIKTFSRNMRKKMTPQELKIWEHIRKKQLGIKFRRQHPINNKFIADFACPELKIIIEIDGSQHIQSKHDVFRTFYLEENGYNVIRFYNNDIDNNIEGCIEYLKQIISNPPPTAQRATSPLKGEENYSDICPLKGGNAEAEAEAKGVQLENSGKENFVNDLEWAIIDDYKELQYIKNKYPQSIMTGSGSTYFLLNNYFEEETGYIVINNLKSINSGVEICKN